MTQNVLDQDTIFLLSESGALERIPAQGYVSEDLLQSLIAEHPELLGGEQIDRDDPIRFLLVKREAGIPDAKHASDRWSVDHLLIDQHGRPTFVEVKRSCDSRIRREVVGQMLDYAANAQAHWPADRIRAFATENLGGEDGMSDALASLIGEAITEEAAEVFWDTVERNLSEGQLRLLFVADRLPTELCRVIEFLNDQMGRIEVLGVEVRQYAGRDLRALVPRVIGQTESARQRKRPVRGPRRPMDAPEFLADCPEFAREFFQEMFREAAARDLIVRFGSTSFSIRVPSDDDYPTSIAYGKATPGIDVFLGFLPKSIDRDEARRHLLEAASFRESGDHTLCLELNDENLEAARAALRELWAIAAQMRSEGCE